MDQQKIGMFILNLRKEKNMTQQELADKIGVTDRAVSKWENGRGMPDLSLMKPLCDELKITINELLSGERIDKKDYQEKLEENILNTIDYTNKKLNKSNNILGIILLVFGFLITLTAFAVIPSESIWSGTYSVLGTIVSLIGFSRFTRKVEYSKRVIFNFGFFIIFLGLLFTLDFINVKLNNVPPMFTEEAIVKETTTYYDTPFYDVFRCNTDKSNEYWIIEKNKKYTDSEIKNYCK